MSGLTAKMRPLWQRRLDPAHEETWEFSRRYSATLTHSGCLQLLKLDLTATHYPRK